MTKLNLKKIAENLIDTFISAGKIAKKISLRGVKITIKPDNSPVTDGDIAVNDILINKIKSLTPDIPIISEETVNFDLQNKNKNFWLIDPIDGTRDYIKKSDEYTLNAALIIDLIPVIGMIYAPSKERLFYSYGKGLAYEINKGEKKKLNCKKRINNKIIGLEHSGKIPPEIISIYKKNKVTETFKMSSSLKFCIIAAGEADIYAAKARAYEWDIAAGHAILEHSGGNITDHEEKEIKYGKHNYKNPPIIAKRNGDLKT